VWRLGTFGNANVPWLSHLAHPSGNWEFADMMSVGKGIYRNLRLLVGMCYNILHIHSMYTVHAMENLRWMTCFRSHVIPPADMNHEAVVHCLLIGKSSAWKLNLFHHPHISDLT